MPQLLINWEKYRPYNFDIIKGITYEIDPTQPPRYKADLSLLNAESERIIHLKRDGKEIMPSDRFYLATNSYRALVDRFPGAGKGNVVCATLKEIPEVILSYIMAQSDEEVLEVNPDYNWGLALEKLRGTQLVVETANNENAEKFIAKQGQYDMTYCGLDPERFALYKIDVDKTLVNKEC